MASAYTPWDMDPVITFAAPAFVSGVLSAAHLVDTSPALGGTVVRPQPLAHPTRALSGAYLAEYVDDFYNHIYAVPAIMDFGVLSSNVAKSVQLWNAHLSDITLTAITPIAVAQGVSISGVSPGLVIKPLQVVGVQFDAAAVGSNSISGTAIFAFGDELASVVVTGVRASMFTYSADWKDSYKVTREFRTTIQTSRSGKEQRRAMRNRARKSLEFTITAHGAGLLAIQRDLSKHLGYTVTMPDETRFVTSTSGALNGADAMVVDSAPAWLHDQVLLRTELITTIKQISAVSGNTVAFTEPFANDWPAGTQILPLLSGRMAQSVSLDMMSDSAATGIVTFNVTPTSEVEVDPPSASVTFNGREVVLLRPNWATPPKVEFGHAFETVDYQQGPIAYFNPIPYVSRTQQLGFTAFDVDEVAQIEDWFTRAKGQRGEFYMPTWQNDIPLIDAVPAGAAGITVPGLMFKEQFATDTVFRAICIVFNDGSTLFAKVLTIYAHDGNSVIDCYPPFARDLTPATVQMICWMPAHRFASDSMTIEWITNKVAQCQLSVVTIEDLTPE